MSIVGNEGADYEDADKYVKQEKRGFMSPLQHKESVIFGEHVKFKYVMTLCLNI